MSILFVALESDSPMFQKLLFIIFPFDIEILRNWRLGIFRLGLCRKCKTCGDRLTNQIDFSLASES